MTSSSQMHNLSQENSLLRQEVLALEHLIRRYQNELDISGYSQDRHECTIIRIEENIYQNQRLNAKNWLSRFLQSDLTEYTNEHGDPCSFKEIVLPSPNWEWINNWYVVVNRNTDAEGWMYGQRWSQLSSKQPHWNSERSISDTLRRRLWRRERVYVGELCTKAATCHQCHLNQVKSQCANKKLTNQLLKANERILEYEDRINIYEHQIKDLQETIHNLRQHASRTSRSMELESDSFQHHELFKQSEKLLSQIESSHDMDFTIADDLVILDVQRRRSAIVEECENELKHAVDEFYSLIKESTPPS